MMDSRPLAERLRPTNLDEYIGQNHIVGKDAPLRKVIQNKNLPSIILWGPPGVGKTTLAQIIAKEAGKPFYTLSAINSGVKDIREIIDKVKKQGLFGGNSAILFIDEIHRFSKSQQDSLLAAVEKGIITLIGATTENPSFEVISALLSRSQVYTLEHHSKSDLENLLTIAITKDEIFSKKNIILEETEALLRLSGGDARKLLNTLEICVNQQFSNSEIRITNTLVESTIQSKITLYDKDGEYHYDIISAFIKSIRGSDPNASLYWLARMIDGGEDPKFIARRLIILASEDIGNANPNALMLANTTFQAVQVIGMPESRIILAQCVTYLASSSKSNAAYMGINEAQQLVKQTGDLPVPLNLRNSPTKLMKELGYGENYQYSHNHPNNFIAQEFLPQEIAGKKLYDPSNNPRENEIRKSLKEKWKSKYEY